MQLIDEFQQEFARQNLSLRLTTYAIIPITSRAGMLETVPGILFCITNDELCITNDGFCIENDEFRKVRSPSTRSRSG